MKLLILLCLLALALPVRAAAPLPTVPRFARFEASFTLPGQTGNPFDPAENAVDVLFQSPGKPPVRVPAFWDGDRWRVRFAPPTVGTYKFTVTRNGQVQAPSDLSPAAFRCVASSNSGFVRRDPKRIQGFVFDNGRTYYPLGINQAWTSGGLPDYPEMFGLMRKNGMNWARVWMTFWDGKALDWAQNKADNPKRGELLLTAARRLDTVMDAATANGVYVQLCLQHHGQYTERTDPNWRDNPANAANGGNLAKPDDFFTDPTARRLTKAKYRYIVARWGYATHLLAWELFNEVQNIGEARGHFADVVAWHKEMAATIRAMDPAHHLVTTSNSPPDDPLAQIGLDYTQVHAYVPDIITFFANLETAKTPEFVAEWGASGSQSEQFLHDGLWASLMAPTAGAGQFWYWDQTAKNNWWPHFASASGFLQRAGTKAAPRRLTPRVMGASGRADLSFGLPNGWGPSKAASVTLEPDGHMTGLSGVSSFVQGVNHRDMLPGPIVFHVRCAAPCEFRVNMGTIARAGAHPELRVDGQLTAEKEYAAGDKDHETTDALTVKLGAGPHAVALFNTGADWFTVQKIVVTNYVPALAVLARGDKNLVQFWAYNRSRDSRTPVSGTVTFDVVTGRYAMQLWDCWNGKPLGPPRLILPGEPVTLPPFARDIAGTLTRRP